MAAPSVLLLELSAYNIAGAAVVSLYLSDLPYATEPSDTPASIAFLPLLTDPLSIRRRVQGIRGGVIEPSLGQIIAENSDGRLDAWAAYAFDGRAITAKIGPQDGAYATDFDVVFTGTMDRVDVTESAVIIRLRDAIAAFDTPLITDLYLGDNVPPDGLEGGEDLEGAPIPRVYGVVKNIPLINVNAQKLIYQVSDNACNLITSIRDSGVTLGKTGQAAPVTVAAFLGAGMRTGFWVEEWSLYVAVTYGGFGGGAATGRVLTSSDAETWTVEATHSGAAPIEDVAWSPEAGLAVAVGFDGEAYSSPDGATWTLETISTLDAYSIAYGKGLFVAVGDGADFYTSPDGSVWTARTTSSSTLMRAVTFANGLFVGVGNSGRITTSPDGIAWTERTSPTGSSGLRMVRYFAQRELWVAVGDSTSGIIVSQDGVTWTERSYPNVGGALSDVCVTENCILAGSSTAGAEAITSPDGVAWNIITIAGTFATRAFIVTPDDDVIAYGTDSGDTEYIALNTYDTFATLANLEDDTLAPAPGTAKVLYHADGTYVRLGSQPFGQLTADVTQGANAAARTAAKLIEAVLTDAGYTSSDWVPADLTALDTADGSAIHGLYVTGQMSVAECLERLAASVGAYWTLDNLGRFRVQQLTAPSGSSTFTITDDNLITLARLTSADPLAGIPSYRTTLRYGRNHVVQTDGVAGGVTAARRAELGREWREVVSTVGSVQTAHLLAQAIVDDTTYAAGSAAQTECTRRQTLRGTMRHAYQATVSLDDYATVDIGAVGTLTSSRFGLSGGQLVRVLGVEPRGRERTVTFLLWF